MYDILNDEIDYIIKRACSAVMIIDRQKYNKYFEFAENFCSKNNILIGGNNGIKILNADVDCGTSKDQTNGKPSTILNKDSYFYQLYTDNTYKKAKEFALELFKHTKDFTISLKTIVMYKEFNVYVDTRLFFNIKAIDNYKGAPIKELIQPPIGCGIFTDSKLKIISGEIYLIHIYRMLYLPYADKVGGYITYTEWLSLENNIFNNAIETLEKKIVGGDDTTSKRDFISFAELRNKILIGLPDEYLIIGDYALPDGIRVKHTTQPRIQLISANSPENITILLKKLMQREVTYEEHNLNLPDDFQIKKYIYYIRDNSGTNVPLVESFNSTVFELLPFQTKRINTTSGKKNKIIGSPFVILRFRFIDLWSLKLIYNLGNKSQFILTRVHEIINDIKELRAATLKIPPEDLFQLDDYMGEYTNEQVMKKKLTGDKFFKIMYPKLMVQN